MVLTDIEGYHDFEIGENCPSDGHWSLSAIIGKGDDPENQNQMPISVDFANNGHHVLCGTVSTGKSTFLQTTIYAFINKYTSDEVNFYILDFSAKLLTVFADSQHVGGIMTDAEEDLEKIAKFFTMINNIMAERKKLLASSNFRDYVEHDSQKLPAIVIAIDNYAAFREKTSEKYEDAIKQLAKEGIAYGIYLIVTAGGFGTNEIPSRLADNFRTTLCLEMPDIYQYSDVMRVVRVPVYPESNIKGRGLVVYSEKIIEFQTALACAGEMSIIDRNNLIRERIKQINAVNSGKAARHIPVIPGKPTWAKYTSNEEYDRVQRNIHLLPNGYDAETAAYSSIDLTSLLTHVVSGTKKSGKSTYLKTLIRACADKGSDICIIELESSEFAQIAADVGARYVKDSLGIYNFAKEVLLEETAKRADKKKECMAQQMEDNEFYEVMSQYQRLCVFIPNVPAFLRELYKKGSEAYNAIKVYETLVGDKGYHYNLFFFVEVNDSDIGDILGYRVMSSFKENGRGIRFGGKYIGQKLFNYANIPFKMQNSAVKSGIGTLATEDEGARIEQIVVPNYKG